MFNLDRQRLNGRELEIEFARGDRKSESAVVIISEGSNEQLCCALSLSQDLPSHLSCTNLAPSDMRRKENRSRGDPRGHGNGRSDDPHDRPPRRHRSRSPRGRSRSPRRSRSRSRHRYPLLSVWKAGDVITFASFWYQLSD